MASDREQVQRMIADHLTDHRRHWNAPYGVLTGLHRLDKGGAYRSITFGVARWLDAEVRIWAPNRIEILGEGALAHTVEGQYGSANEVIDKLRSAAEEEVRHAD